MNWSRIVLHGGRIGPNRFARNIELSVNGGRLGGSVLSRILVR